MSVTYDGLWKILIEKHIRRKHMAVAVGIDQNILARLGKNEYVTLPSLEKICNYLDCDIGDIVRIAREDDLVDTKKPIVPRKRSIEELESILFDDE